MKITNEKMKKLHFTLILIIIILFILVGVTIVTLVRKNNLISRNVKETDEPIKMLQTEATYKVNEINENVMQVTIKIKNDLGISKVITPTGIEIKPLSTKKTLSIDYEVISGNNYAFKIQIMGDEEIEEYVLKANTELLIDINQTESYAYPIITENGVIGASKNIKINYGTNINNYYSLDNGVTWEEYSETINIVQEGKIMAKSVRENEIIQVEEENITLELADNAVSGLACDEDYETFSGNIEEQFILVDSSMEGKSIIIDSGLYASSAETPYYEFLDDNKERIGEVRWTERNKIETIPITCEYIRFKNCAIYEIEKGYSSLIPIMTDFTDTTGGIASSKSTYSSYYAWHAFDGNNNTYAFSDVGDALDWWIAYEFPEPVFAYKVVFKFASGSVSGATRVVKLQGSNDNESWDDLTNEISTGGYYTFEEVIQKLKPTKKYKIYRLYTTEVSGNTDLSGVTKFEIYGE